MPGARTGLWSLVAALVLTTGSLVHAGPLLLQVEAYPKPMHPGVPLPRPRPLIQFGNETNVKLAAVPSPDVKSDAKIELETATPVPSACQIRLGADRAVITPLPPVTGPGECRIDDPVRLDAILLPDKSRVVLKPAATLRCGMAEAIVNWVREDAAPIAAQLGAPMTTVLVEDSFDCRGRNRVIGAKISEHGFGNALDISGFILANNKPTGLTDIAVEKAIRERIRLSACTRFNTVLGPGSDGHHESHIHLDLAERRSGYRMCQWAVRDINDLPPPMPRERPAEAPPRVAQTNSADSD